MTHPLIDEIVIKKPGATGGAYRDPEFIRAWWDLANAVKDLMLDDRSHGNLSIGGAASMCRARCKAVVDKAKSMETIMKAVTANRK